MDIDFEKFESAQDYLMFFIHINRLIESGGAEFAPTNNKIINLSFDTSNIFSFGRDENMRPFIGVQEDFLPWFFNLDWSEINILMEGNRAFIYLISKADNGEINFAYGLRVKPRRIVVLFDRRRENLEDTFCSLKVAKIGEKKGEIMTSYNSQVSNLKVRLINSVNDIVQPNEGEDKYDPNRDPNTMTFVKNK